MTRTMKTERKQNKLLSAAGIFLAALSALLSCVMPVYAEEEKGSLTLRCVYNGAHGARALSNDEFSLVKVADAHTIGGRISYTTLESFESFACEWSEQPASELNKRASAVADHCMKNDLFTDSKTTDENGELKFDDLGIGLYLAVRTKSDNANSAYVIDPLFVFIPQTINGEAEYNVAARPKIGYTETDRHEDGDDDADKPKTPWDDILPQTGQLLWPVVVLAVIGGFLILGGSAALPKEDRDEKKIR